MIDIATLQALNAPTREERLENLQKAVQTASFPEANPVYINCHIHTTYSFSPYSPAAAVFAAKAEGLCTAGIVDHDTTAGAEEFIEAGKIADMPVTVGMEARVSMVCTAGSPTPRQKRFRLAANGSAIATAWFLKVRSVKAWRLASAPKAARRAGTFRK